MRPTRGSLVAIIRLASTVGARQNRQIMAEVDKITDPGTTGGPYGGGKISREAFRQLLANDRITQQRVYNQLPFMTEQEKASLERDLSRVMPAQPPASVTQMPGDLSIGADAAAKVPGLS